MQKGISCRSRHRYIGTSGGGGVFLCSTDDAVGRLEATHLDEKAALLEPGQLDGKAALLELGQLDGKEALPEPGQLDGIAKLLSKLCLPIAAFWGGTTVYYVPSVLEVDYWN